LRNKVLTYNSKKIELNLKKPQKKTFFAQLAGASKCFVTQSDKCDKLKLPKRQNEDCRLHKVKNLERAIAAWLKNSDWRRLKISNPI
jgi:hypothetical protein